MTETEVKIFNSVCKINQEHKVLQRHPICLTDSNYYFILDGIKHKYIIGYERDTSVENK